MKLSVSNIAWSAENDPEMYAFLQKQGFTGLEVAPTRLFPERPYEHLGEAQQFAQRLKADYGLDISSMQSIWYGITENIFGTDADRIRLIDYTKKAVDFASAVGCENLVFGCPKNRALPSEAMLPAADDFFNKIGNHAAEHGVVIALEPNPPYYGTNFINTTEEAFVFCLRLGNKGIKVNVDLGTCIQYNETVELLNENSSLINHVHISEPMLAPIEKRELHNNLKRLNFASYFSIEMGNKNDLDIIKSAICYIGEILA